MQHLHYCESQRLPTELLGYFGIMLMSILTFFALILYQRFVLDPDVVGRTASAFSLISLGSCSEVGSEAQTEFSSESDVSENDGSTEFFCPINHICEKIKCSISQRQRYSSSSSGDSEVLDFEVPRDLKDANEDDEKMYTDDISEEYEDYTLDEDESEYDDDDDDDDDEDDDDGDEDDDDDEDILELHCTIL